MMRNILRIHGKSCELTCNGTAGRYHISVSEKVNIPAMAEMIVEDKAEDGKMIPKELCLVESSDSLRNT